MLKELYKGFGLKKQTVTDKKVEEINTNYGEFNKLDKETNRKNEESNENDEQLDIVNEAMLNIQKFEEVLKRADEHCRESKKY